MDIPYNRTLEAAKACYNLIWKFLSPENEESLYNGDPYHFPVSFSSSLHKSTQTRVRDSYDKIRAILKEWDISKLSISYNGGKDCLVELIIYIAAVYEFRMLNNCKDDLHIKAAYVHTEEEFEELMTFLQTSVAQFGLDFTAVYTNASIQTIPSSPNITRLYSEDSTLQSGFLRYLEHDPEVEAIIVGIRRTDPYGSDLQLQQKTDFNKGWPDFMRINPILEWHTGQIWYFIKWLEKESKDSDFNIKYCRLYDEGYTSIGGKDSTVKNPKLRKDEKCFWPAWWDTEDDIERLSRVQKGKV